MKSHYLLIVFLCLFSTQVHAQTYQFSRTLGTYNDLTGTTIANNNVTWDDPQFILPIGFSFQLYDTTITELVIEDWGFGTEIATSPFEDEANGVIIPYGADLIDRGSDTINYSGQSGSLSPISYKTSGTAGSRIFKLEWKNAGFYNDISNDNVSTDYINVQLWLYEGSNDIEIRIGNSLITQGVNFDGFSGPHIGLYPSYNSDTDVLFSNGVNLDGMPSAPITKSASSIYQEHLDEETIQSGTIYKFKALTVGIEELADELEYISIRPNPAKDFIAIDLNNDLVKIKHITLTNANGQKIEEINYNFERVDISELSTGVYFVQIHTDKGTINKKIVKK